MRPRTGILVALLLAAAACGDDRSTPRGTFEALRAALVERDGAALDALTDMNGVLHRRAEIRERRAMLERGDDPTEVMGDMPLSAEEVRRGTEADAAGLLLERRSPLFSVAGWIGAAEVVEEIADGPDCACVRLKGADGAMRELWFVRENGRWCYDQFRSRQSW